MQVCLQVNIENIELTAKIACKCAMSVKKKEKEKETDLDFKGMPFEEILEDLLKIKPVENADLKIVAPKKKSKPKTKK